MAYFDTSFNPRYTLVTSSVTLNLLVFLIYLVTLLPPHLIYQQRSIKPFWFYLLFQTICVRYLPWQFFCQISSFSLPLIHLCCHCFEWIYLLTCWCCQYSVWLGNIIVVFVCPFPDSCHYPLLQCDLVSINLNNVPNKI